MDKLIESLKSLHIPESEYFDIGSDVQCAYDKANEMLDDCIDIVKKNEQPIYQILMLDEKLEMDELGWPIYGRTEIVGFYYEKDVALSAVKDNWADINDGGIYNAALVIEAYPGLYPHKQYVGYFIWSKIKQAFIEAKLPEGMEHFILS